MVFCQLERWQFRQAPEVEVVVVVDVALLARNVGVAVGEQEARGAVIEFCTEPAIETMTALALG